MSSKLQAIRGMNDCLPEQSAKWQIVERCIRQVVASYGYQEIRTPIVESTDLFKRSIGEVTDIVEKEMYTFEDRNGDSLTLRPEGTASCVRAGIEHGLLYNQQQRLWYMGQMFRHEKPQKGRYRQFHQFGVETYGFEGPDIDVEVIAISARLWKLLGVDKHVVLEINSLGSNEARHAYKNTLVAYLTQHKDQLDEDSLRRLNTNPLRILDSKNPQVQAVVQAAPKLMDCLDEASVEHFAQLREQLAHLGIQFRVNPNLVRGLDYYNRTVFEWVTDALGAQGTVCAGGRYDGLVEQLGGKASPAVGFALGLERLVLLMETVTEETLEQAQTDVYVVTMGENAHQYGFKLVEQIRDVLPNLRVLLNQGGGNMKKQMKRADKTGAKLALIVGEEEMISQSVGVKSLREQQEQQTLAVDDLMTYLAAQIL